MLLGQLVGSQLLLAGQRMSRGQQHNERFVIERQGNHFRLLERQGNNNGIQLRLPEFLPQVGGIVLFDIERHFRGRPPQFGEQVREQIGTDGVDRTDLQRRIELVLAILSHVFD